jgi:hypothetical protein
MFKRRDGMSGTLVYWVPDGMDRFRLLKLTVCSDEDGESGGLASRRRMRLSRILREATRQGARLSYSDLSMIMLSSKSTLKRDVSYLRGLGVDIPIGSRAA